MRTLRRFKLLFEYDSRTLLLLAEAYCYLAWARLLLYIPFAKLAPRLGNRMDETPHEHECADPSLVKHIASSVNLASKYTPWESKCLVRAIAGQKMLVRRRIDSTLYLGTGRDKDGGLAAHAWLRSGPVYLTGADVMRQFVVVEKFAKRVNTPKRSHS